MQTGFTKTLSLIFTVILALPMFPKALFDYAVSAGSQNIVQYERLQAMRKGEITVVDEQSFASFDLACTTVKYNEVRTLTTHNSYKKALPESLYNISTRVFGPDKFKSTMYEHNTLVNQLENGVRGLELDIRWQPAGFKICHSTAPDNLSNSPDWKMTLEELKLWSNANPNHVPVTVLVEIKYDNPYRNPLYGKMNAERFAQLDETVKKIMGGKAVTAADFMGSYATLGAMVENNAWPTLSSLKGKFIFLLHPDDEYTALYINTDPTLKSRMFIPVISPGDIEKYHDYAAFLLYNSPDVLPIQELVAKNYIVRTMMDSGLVYDKARKEASLESGAQMLSTDLEKGVILPKSDYTATLEGSFTIIDS